MRKLMFAFSAASVLALGAFGCSHSYYEAKADHYQHRANSAAEHGNYHKAAREQQKADRDQAKADYAPLP